MEGRDVLSLGCWSDTLTVGAQVELDGSNTWEEAAERLKAEDSLCGLKGPVDGRMGGLAGREVRHRGFTFSVGRQIWGKLSPWWPQSW